MIAILPPWDLFVLILSYILAIGGSLIVGGFLLLLLAVLFWGVFL